jgi:hypothetical protein
MVILSQAAQASSTFNGLGGLLSVFFVIILVRFIFKEISSTKKKKRTGPPKGPQGTRPPRKAKRPAFHPGYQDIRNFNPEGKRVFGIPGFGLSEATHFSDASIKSGIEGEVKTAEIIDKFAVNSTNCYVFHSLMWPLSSTEADVDHIIVCGDNILLIDSKNWKRKGVYAFDWDGNVTLDGERYYYGRSPKVIAAREKYHNYLQEIFRNSHKGSVNSAIVIHNDESSVNTKPYGFYNHLSTAHQLESFLRDWELSLGIVEDNRKLLCAIHSLLK